MFIKSSSIDTSSLNASSKLDLKMSCLQACNNDIDKASKLYNYIAEGMDLPDMTPRPPSTFEQIRQGAEEVLQWANAHQNEFVNAFTIIQNLRGKAGAVSEQLPNMP